MVVVPVSKSNIKSNIKSVKAVSRKPLYFKTILVKVLKDNYWSEISEITLLNCSN